MIGAVAGSIYEFDNQRDKRSVLFPYAVFFTDDTVLTVALAEMWMNSGNYGQTMRRWYRRYPQASYGMPDWIEVEVFQRRINSFRLFRLIWLFRLYLCSRFTPWRETKPSASHEYTCQNP